MIQAATYLPAWSTMLTALLALVGSAGFGGLLVKWFEHKRGVRKQTDDVALSLVEQLSRRLETMEASAASERALCDANLSVLRHRMNNLASSFDGLLLLIEMAPDKAAEFVEKIKAKRAAQEAAEAAEKAAVSAATIAAAKTGSGHHANP